MCRNPLHRYKSIQTETILILDVPIIYIKEVVLLKKEKERQT